MNSDAAFQIGDLVEAIAKKPEWGMGKIVHLRDDLASVFYRDQPTPEAKRFRTTSLKKARAQNDPRLDNLPEFESRDGTLRIAKDFQPLEVATGRFRSLKPLGFDEDRAAKWAAHEQFELSLGEGKGVGLVGEGNVREVGKRVMAVIALAGKLVTKTEVAALQEGLKDKDAAAVYFAALFALPEEPSQESFEQYLDAAATLPVPAAHRWTVVTLLPFIAYPSSYMFLKPANVQKAAGRLGFEIHYNATPNWRTYAAVLDMCRMYQAELKDLAPRDFMDVQSFLWVAAAPVARLSQG